MSEPSERHPLCCTVIVASTFLQIRSAVTDYDAGVGGKKKKKKKGSSKKQAPPADAAPADKKAIAKAAAAKNKKANEKKAAAAEKKKKTALSLPDDGEEEIDLVAKMEAARRAMPNACVVRGKETNIVLYARARCHDQKGARSVCNVWSIALGHLAKGTGIAGSANGDVKNRLEYGVRLVYCRCQPLVAKREGREGEAWRMMTNASGSGSGKVTGDAARALILRVGRCTPAVRWALQQYPSAIQALSAVALWHRHVPNFPARCLLLLHKFGDEHRTGED